MDLKPFLKKGGNTRGSTCLSVPCLKKTNIGRKVAKKETLFQFYFLFITTI